ncbi:MAG: D-alanyl-D-alanine carboxypeptidase, partial [Firmicutes bacterium]|nr:D-alanyl-D-alanine carboxypeptidase [Bacillota bacterium]
MRWLAVALLFNLLAGRAALAAPPRISAAAALLMDADTGQVYYARNPDQRRPPASLTKILTGLLAVEMGSLEDPVTISRRAAGMTEGQHLGMRAGDVISLGDLVRAALVYSANDTTVAIAEHIAGSEELFRGLMNAKALSLGALNTHFVNPHGLTEPDHYSSARDLALLTRFALQNPVFAATVRLPCTTVHWQNRKNEALLYNTNRLLGSYPGMMGVKTGTTTAAGKCLVGAAEREGRRLISVVLNSGDRYADTAKLLDYGFRDVSFCLEVAPGEEVGVAGLEGGQAAVISLVAGGKLTVRADPDDLRYLEKRVYVPRIPRAPVARGTPLGELVVLLRG